MANMVGMRNFSASRAHMTAANHLIPGGAHTYAKGDDQYPEGMAPVIDRGAGCRVWDVDGNEYVEFGNGLRSTTLGHGFEPVLRAVRRHLSSGVNFVRPHWIEREAAERITELIPSAEMVKFGLNGSDVTAAAVRLARAFTGRSLVAVCRDHPMFGTGDWFIGTTPMAAGIPAATRRLTLGFNYNDLPGLADLFNTYPGQIAAVMLEAEAAEPPAPGFLSGLRRLCDEHGALLVFDEIITGFRWHERGAQFVYGVTPDLSTFGKAMANGFPVSALVGRRDVMRLGGLVEDADRVFLLSQTGSAQPWALAAALAVIDVYQQSAIADQLHRIGAALRTGIDGVIAAAGLAPYVQLKGRDCNMVYVARDGEGAPSQAFRTLLLQEVVGRGVLAPSLVVSAAHDPSAIDHTVSAFGEATVAYRRALDHGVETVLRGRPVRPALRRRG